ncbi:hypothetical protein DTL21_14095 [Bremerella cremea]|uniref:HEAT repeat domain-containing protein n=1 Tax=Blastopirellula marina TaxID=124 RepID=A0A2S8FR27_9BACT|nr:MULTISPECIES: HEAT repeat domain-containing protein [Pirellulaceae]PQO34635.1 hypothetical protein C5Y83_14090 [Blastopirellula marina]RCS47132.1 hypothetical protein DTL21_14095 [Bremerella cremea]
MLSNLRLNSFWPVIWLITSIATAAEPNRDDAAQQKILTGLADRDPEVIRQTLDKIQFIGPTRLRPFKDALIPLVGNPEASNFRTAIELLAEIGPDAIDALPAIEPHLANPSPEIRLYTAEAVWRIGGRSKQASAVLVDLLQAKTIDPKNPKDDTWFRDAIATRLRWIGLEAGSEIERLLQLTSDPRDDIRQYALSILGSLGPSYRAETEKQLTASLQDPIPQVRLAAATSLAEVDARLDQAVAVLIELAKQEVPASPQAERDVWAENYVPSSAIQVLGEWEADAIPAVPILAKLLKSNVLAVRLEAATALGRIGSPAREAIPALSAAMQETEYHSMPFVHQAWCVGENAAKSLGQIGLPAVASLTEALKDKDPTIRAWATSALGEIPIAAPQTVGPLSERLSDENAYVRLKAIKALGKLGPAAVGASPQLARLLLSELDITTFSSGSGIGQNHSTSEAAWETLVKLNPSAEQIIPPLVEGLQNAESISYAAICALREYPDASEATKEPLQRLLKQPKSRVAAACALAFVDPANAEIQSILEEAVFDEEESTFLAALGLEQLASSGKTFDSDFRQRLLVHSQQHFRPQFSLAVYRLLPDHPEATQRLAEVIVNAHSLFDANARREATQTLPGLIRRHPSLKQAFSSYLNFTEPPSDDQVEWERIQHQTHIRLQATAYLLFARVDLDQVMNSLNKLANENEAYKVIEVLTKDLPVPAEAVPLLTNLLENNEYYIVNGDFYGNGGEGRVVGDRAARVLVQHGAKDALITKINHSDARVRKRVVAALGQLVEASSLDAISPHLADRDYEVRAASVIALGRIGQTHPMLQERIAPLLRQAKEDRRRVVREAATQAQAAFTATSNRQETTGTGAAK